METRRGQASVNTELDQLLDQTGHLTTDQLAELLILDTVTGAMDSTSSGPVGRWVLGELQALGIEAVAYSWVASLAVYDRHLALLGEVAVPHGHTLADLEHEVNDGDHPDLLHQGDTDPR